MDPFGVEYYMEDKTSSTKNNKKSIKSDDGTKTVLSFDAYFSGLMTEKRGFILPHHKAPMRSYAESKGLVTGTREQFDELFKVY
jgi:hypothetical protein